MNSSATLVSTGPTTLPLLLIQAQHLCFQKTAVMDLGRTARAALSGILAFVKVRSPMSVIWPKRATLREQARLNSDSALYRGLAELFKKGYIERETQLRNAQNGRFHISRLHLTEKAIHLLNLNKTKKVINNQPSSKMGDGYIENIVNYLAPSIEESPDTQNSFSNPSAKKSSIQKLDPETNLPKPLVKLTWLGLSPKTICWLMKIAKQKQKRLEDVMNFAWKYLQPLASKGSKTVKAYLVALLSKNQDFAFQVRQDQENKDANEAKEKRSLQIRHIIENHQGHYVMNKNNQPIGLIEGETIRFFALKANGFTERYMPIWQVDQSILSSLVLTQSSYRLKFNR
jgi:hypothetical protein